MKKISRREFIRDSGMVLASSGLALFIAPSIVSSAVKYDWTKHEYGYTIEIDRCIGCGMCAQACKAENSVPDTFYRTWVERYSYLKNGEVIVDSPNGALDGFHNGLQPLVATESQPLATIDKSFFVPKPLMPFIFILSAMVLGIAMMIILYVIAMKIIGVPHCIICFRRLAVILWSFLIVDATLELMEVVHIAYEGGEAWAIISQLLARDLHFTFYTLQLGICTLIPFLLLGFVVIFYEEGGFRGNWCNCGNIRITKKGVRGSGNNPDR